MRRQRRWPISLFVMLFAIGVLLLLSALIEAPAADAQPADTAPAAAHTVLLPAVLPSPETPVEARNLTGAFLPPMLFVGLLCMLPLLVPGSDANGRVLRKRRYARSFYPVFRQELACG